jgi:hypothetical protein
MRQLISKHVSRLIGIVIFLLAGLALRAQEKIDITTTEVETWFERNWMWVAGAVVLLLLIVLLSRNRANHGSRRTTTVIKDPDGNTKSVTTTEENT